MANKTQWIFEQNPFLHATEASYRLAVRISTYHRGALQAVSGDPFFGPLYSAYKSIDDALNAAYDGWKTQGGTQKGQTLTVNQNMRLLSGTKARAWDVAIQGVYPIGTAKYTALLPNHRIPFQQGTQTDRIAAVKALSNAIGTDASLASVKADADAFYGQINTALLAQKGQISGTKTDSDAVEKARIDMCNAQYGNLGAIMQHYATAPDNIGQYFDLTAIRSGAQVIFTGETNANEFENVFKHTFATGDTVRLENEGVTELHFYLAAEKNDPQPSSFVTVTAGNQKTVSVTDLGPITNTYLNVFNPDAVNKGDWTVELE